MSLNLENKGVPIAMIMTNNKPSKVVSIDDSTESVKDITLNDSNQRFQVVGDPKRERDIIYITGRSGSGKSYFIKDYVNNYYKMVNKKRPIYLFSALSEDETIDQIKNLHRVKLDEEFLNDDEITINDFAKSYVIFDDTDVIKSKPILEKVNQLMNQMLETGRHHQITCLITKHTPTNGRDTKLILAESHQFILFPNGLGNKSLKYLLDNYLGLDRTQVKKIKKLKTRWVCINRATFPLSIVSEKDCFVLNNDDE